MMVSTLQEQQRKYALIIELGLAQQKLHMELSTASAIFAERVFCGCDLDSITSTGSSSTTQSNNSTEFHGFLKLEGCAIAEANITVPSKNSSVNMQIVREEHSPLVLPQLVAARNITERACTRLKTWLDMNGRPALKLDASIYELLELRREIESARHELLGRHLPLYPNNDEFTRNHTNTTKEDLSKHIFHTSLPNNMVVEVGIQQAHLCLFVWTLAPIPASTMSKLVENVQNIGASMFRNFGGKEDATHRNLISSQSLKSNTSKTGFVVGERVVTHFSSCMSPVKPAVKMLKHLDAALRTCDRILTTVQNM
jgi:hypothetical protein